MNIQPAILIFARRAAAEAQTKWSHLPALAADRLAQALLEETIHTVRATGYDYIVVDESMQQGLTFGDRITHAISTVLATHDSTIVIGADCPGLTADCLRVAATQLQQGYAVLGPDRRGGIYLIGLTKASFSSIDWSSIRWETSSVYSDLAEQVDCEVLDVLTDIHKLSDVLCATHRGEVGRQLAISLLSYFIVRPSQKPHLNINVHRLASKDSPRRGPPVIAA